MTARANSTPTPLLIDSHIHFDFPAFDGQRSELLQITREAGIQHFIVPATTRQSFKNIAGLSQNKSISAAYGLHSYFTEQHSDDDLGKLDAWLSDKKAIALGGIGLDFTLNNLIVNANSFSLISS